MRFLFLTYRFHPNKTFMVKSLLDHGHGVHFFVRQMHPLERHDVIQPTKIEYSPLYLFLKKIAGARPGPSRFDWLYGFPRPLAYANRIRKLRPDIAVIQNPNEVFALITAMIAALLGIKTVFFVDRPLHGIVRSRWKVWILDRLSHAWIGPVLGEPEKYRILSPKAHYLPLPIERQISSSREYFAGDRVNIILVAKLGMERKGHRLVLQAIRDLLKEGHALSLLIVGTLGDKPGKMRKIHDDYYRSLQDYVKKEDLENIVRFRADIPITDVFKEYLGADIFVMPSIGEPVGFALLEAMAHGLPVIASDTTGARCYMEDGESGYVVKTGSTDDLTKKLRFLVSDRARIREMGKRSLELTAEHHDPEVFYGRFMAIVR